MPHDIDGLVEAIPPAQRVREALTQTLLRVQLLRGLLRIAERKERQRGSHHSERKEAKRAS